MSDGAPAIPALMKPGRPRDNLWLGLCLLLLALSWRPHPAVAGDSQLPLRLAPAQVKQGGVSMLSIEVPSGIRTLRVQVGDREVLVASPAGQLRAAVLVGIDLEQPPGPVPVRADVVDAHGRPLAGQSALRVLHAHFPVQRLTVPRTFVELDATTLERVGREKAALDRLWESLTPERLWRGPFRVPLDGAGPGYGFGERRIINGEPRSPHSGADFAASAGTPVLAANAGIVAMVGDHFFAGTSIILDHGLGLYTMYFHLQESLVQPGQRVDRGQVIARVGTSGRATGAHLHWGARLHGARIDPRELVDLNVTPAD